MIIYDYLFYKTYLLAKKSGNFNDTPVLGGIIFVIACVMFNIFAVLLVLEGANVIVVDFEKKYNIPFAILLVGAILMYYLYKDRYKRIILKYEDKENDKFKLPSVVVILIYYLISFSLGTLASLYKSQVWIFAP